MLVQLLPDQISKFWDVIKYAVEQSLPPTVGDHPDKMNRILSGLLCGRLECWASYAKTGNTKKFEGIVITQLLYDDASDTKNLLIYCLYGYELTQKSTWAEGFKTILKYAETRKCSQIVAYTEVPNIVRLVQSLGAETKYTFISFDVNKSIKKLNGLWG